MDLRTATAPPAPLRTAPVDRAPVRVALVQTRWHEDRDEHLAVLEDGIRTAAEAGARVVFLPELTLRRYPGDTRAVGVPKDDAESLVDGPTVAFARTMATRYGLLVHASLFERPAADDDAEDPRGYNTAVLLAPDGPQPGGPLGDGSLLGATRKTHIPVSAGYHEDTYFRQGPGGPRHGQDSGTPAFPVVAPEGLGARLGLPTCWDEWFPEVARAYALAGAEILAYPTAIGSEPSFPAFDTAGIWRSVIVANGITSGLFMVVPNRWGDEGEITFYGSSFISDPFGRVLVEAPRDADVVLVADLDLAQREEWLALFPFFETRRPDLYAGLTGGPAAVAGTDPRPGVGDVGDAATSLQSGAAADVVSGATR